MDQQAFHGGGAHGYTDYPALDHNHASAAVAEKAPARNRPTKNLTIQREGRWNDSGLYPERQGRVQQRR